MKNTTPDSVARFICRAALGQVKGAGIESLGVATSYAYEKYSGNDLDSFGDEYDNFVSSPGVVFFMTYATRAVSGSALKFAGNDSPASLLPPLQAANTAATPAMAINKDLLININLAQK